MEPAIEAKPTSCDKAEFSTAQKELRDNPFFEHLMRTCRTFSKARKTLAYILRLIVLSTNLEYRARERQRERER